MEVPGIGNIGNIRKTFEIAGSTVVIEDDNLIRVISVGELTDNEVDEVFAIHQKILSVTSGKINVLVDLNKAGKSTPYARRLYKRMSEDARIGKVALFGLHPVARAIASFIVGRTSRNNTGFFHNEKNAIAWFKK